MQSFAGVAVTYPRIERKERTFFFALELSAQRNKIVNFLTMTHRTRNAIAISVISLFCISFILGGSYLIYRQKTGITSTASVTACKKIRRAEICNGFWSYDNKIQFGEVENANSDDLGAKIQVLVTQDRAVKPSLTLPIALYLIAFGLALMGLRWWQTEAYRE
ncbi:hypothetical protein A0128_08095 [Leptospira tipperaryensis]|uniref:Uncharacterized protein n=1 Tax=Leptospira tipperaryensis TaxID=2564040 RepID=A0A1D7UW32_9LEPT|nr:hypothetical protein [Leptospira tipperaryensis]AOP33807.1 hypothetical protein A0128_08095 [Leptospira tipperaryensis]